MYLTPTDAHNSCKRRRPVESFFFFFFCSSGPYFLYFQTLRTSLNLPVKNSYAFVVRCSKATSNGTSKPTKYQCTLTWEQTAVFWAAFLQPFIEPVFRLFVLFSISWVPHTAKPLFPHRTNVEFPPHMTDHLSFSLKSTSGLYNKWDPQQVMSWDAPKVASNR